MGDGLNGNVYDLEIHGGRLYAGGGFTATLSSTPLSHLAVYDDGLNQWVDVGGGVSDIVNTLKSTPTGLVVGGIFANAGPSAVVVNNIAHLGWDQLEPFP